MGMDRPPQNKANKFWYKEKDRRLKVQFINGINDNDMGIEKIGELTTFKKTNEVTSEHVLAWARRVVAQRPRKQ